MDIVDKVIEELNRIESIALTLSPEAMRAIYDSTSEILVMLCDPNISIVEKDD